MYKRSKYCRVVCLTCSVEQRDGHLRCIDFKETFAFFGGELNLNKHGVKREKRKGEEEEIASLFYAPRIGITSCFIPSSVSLSRILYTAIAERRRGSVICFEHALLTCFRRCRVPSNFDERAICIHFFFSNFLLLLLPIIFPARTKNERNLAIA